MTDTTVEREAVETAPATGAVEENSPVENPEAAIQKSNTGGEEDGESEDDDVRPVFSTVEEFVTNRIAPVYSRAEGGQFRWCAEWWRHEEAFLRFHALWHAWEIMRREPMGLANWYRDYFDLQFPTITSDTGPFRQCTARRHEEPRPLPVKPAPEGWFEDES